jgi:hypothetical protein
MRQYFAAKEVLSGGGGGRIAAKTVIFVRNISRSITKMAAAKVIVIGYE